MKQNGPGFTSFLPGIAWFFIVAALVFMPGNDMPEAGWLDLPNLDKIVHAVMFGGLTFLFCLPICRSQYPVKLKYSTCMRIALAAIAWGIGVEFIQRFFVSGRSFEMADWAADTAGVLAAWWLSRKLIKTRHTRAIRQQQ